VSSFIVEEETINRIVTFLYDHFLKTDILSSMTKAVLKEYDISVESIPECTFLANAFLYMNKLAVDDRYSENNLLSALKFKRIESNEIQVLKSMQCLQYQCSEGDVPKLPMYKCLNRLIGVLESHIISELPEYNQATWG
jgi:hypothetical protein